MTIKIEDPNESVSDFLARALKSDEVKGNNSEKLENLDAESQKIDPLEFRQLQQKQALSTGLTHLLFEKFKEIYPAKKQSNIEFTDISWYKQRLDEKK